jgi:hypothetical protein
MDNIKTLMEYAINRFGYDDRSYTLIFLEAQDNYMPQLYVTDNRGEDTVAKIRICRVTNNIVCITY